MVRRTVELIATKINGLKEAAFWLALFALLSQLLALMRDRLLTHHFGAGVDLDIYYAAFKIPDLIFVTVASLVSISVLVPLYAKREMEGEKHLHDATSSIFTVFSLSIILSCVAAWFLLPQIVPLFFGAFGAGMIERIIALSRLLLFSPLLLGFSNFFGSIVQYEKRFILYSISPLLYNMGIIVGIVFGVEDYGISAAVFGVIVGAFLHLFLQAAFVLTSDVRLRFTFRIKWRDVLETAGLSIPRTFALAIVTFTSFIFASLASRLGEGSVAVFNLGLNLQSAPLSLIGVSFSLAAFPALAMSAARKNIEEITERISDGLRQIIFWSLPTTALMLVLRAHIVRVIFGSGNFDWNATRLTAAVMALFVISTVFQSAQLFLSRSLYALGKTKWPLLGNLLGGLVSIALAFWFVMDPLFWQGPLTLVAEALNVAHLPLTVLSLPVAFSFGIVVAALILYFSFGKLSTLIYTKIKNIFAHAVVAALGAGFAAYSALVLTDGFFDLETFFGVLGHGALAGVVGIAVWAFTLYLLKNEEYKKFLHHSPH